MWILADYKASEKHKKGELETNFLLFLLFTFNTTHKQMKRKILFITVLLSFSFQSYAFDVVGHRIISEIAYENLKCRTRKKVDKLLGKRGIIYTSAWADDVRNDSAYTHSYNWHFQNLKDGMTKAELHHLLNNPKSEGEYLLFALDSLAESLKNNKNDREALMFIVHFAADLFQPMHLGRLSDRGGNDVMIRWFGRKIRLHQLWDTQMLQGQKFSYSEYSQYIQDKFSKQKKEFKKQSKLDAIWETYLLRNKIYAYDYSNLKGYQYLSEFSDDMDRQLFSAGIQLANLLNEIF